MPLSQKRIMKQFKYGMYFNGVNDYVDLGAPSVIKNFSQSSFTVITWFYSLGLYKPNGSLNFGRIVSDDNHPVYDGIEGMWGLSQGECGLTTTQACIVFFFRGENPVVFNCAMIYHRTWNMISVVRDLYAKQNRGYVNNSLFATQSITGYTYSPNTYPVSIGGETDTSRDKRLKVYGLIAQVLIYSRALSDSEIQYNYQNPNKPVTNGLVLWLQVDPKYIQGNKWIDLSGYGNDGSIYNAQLMQLEKTPARILNAKRVLGAVR
jgi:hypothetical protein